MNNQYQEDSQKFIQWQSLLYLTFINVIANVITANVLWSVVLIKALSLIIIDASALYHQANLQMEIKKDSAIPNGYSETWSLGVTHLFDVLSVRWRDHLWGKTLWRFQAFS